MVELSTKGHLLGMGVELMDIRVSAEFPCYRASASVLLQGYKGNSRSLAETAPDALT